MLRQDRAREHAMSGTLPLFRELLMGNTSASDLSGSWTDLESVVPGGSSINLPDHVQKVGDVYHVYYSVSRLGAQLSAIGLATPEDRNPEPGQIMGPLA
ncbi:hypothetical protein ACJ72_00492 [Emergomyces africanus]|uniref:Uncharacterized protein n=1 Tax=Emergomyces africanus TaxID=1955775 RepID=A0A1B7P7W1_9EURO|nr:hypothetical protein ACJ72_00492 [Emergomyces africanus]